MRLRFTEEPMAWLGVRVARCLCYIPTYRIAKSIGEMTVALVIGCLIGWFVL